MKPKTELQKKGENKKTFKAFNGENKKLKIRNSAQKYTKLKILATAQLKLLPNKKKKTIQTSANHFDSNK